jgi:hypothetical protein
MTSACMVPRQIVSNDDRGEETAWSTVKNDHHGKDPDELPNEPSMATQPRKIS